MSIGIVSDDDFLQELESYREPHRNVVPSVEPLPTRGRDKGDNNVPDSLRKIIGEEHLLNGRHAAQALAADLGISKSSVSAYAKGATSTTTYNEPKKSILDHINKSRQRAIKKASNTLNSALSSITQEKLDYSDAKDLSAIAKDMSVVIRNLEPQSSDGVGSDKQMPQFVIYAPQVRQESAYEVIDVSKQEVE